MCRSKVTPIVVAGLVAFAGLALAADDASRSRPAVTFEGLVCIGDGYSTNVVSSQEELKSKCLGAIAGAQVEMALGSSTIADAKGRWKLGPIPIDAINSGALNVDAEAYSGFSGFPTSDLLTRVAATAKHAWVLLTLPDGSETWEDLRTSKEDAACGINAATGASAGGCSAWQIGGPPLRAFLQEQIDKLALIDLKGRSWTKQTFLGKVTLVDFWGTWCAPCRMELPHIEAALKRFGRRGFQTIGIAFESSDTKTFKQWCDNHHVTWPQVVPEGGLEALLAKQFDLPGYPTSIVVGPRGDVIGVNLKARRINTVLEDLLREIPKP